MTTGELMRIPPGSVLNNLGEYGDGAGSLPEGGTCIYVSAENDSEWRSIIGMYHVVLVQGRIVAVHRTCLKPIVT